MTDAAMRFAPVRGLREGGHLRVIAPSSPFDRAAFDRGLERLRARYEVSFDEGLFSTEGFLAGDDARRLEELHGALRDPRVDAIVCARGGYGAMRLLPALDLALVGSARKLLVGFSDVTALHAVWQHAGLRSLHGSMVAALGRLPDERVARWMRAVEGYVPIEGHAPSWATRGRVVAPLVGGNLAILAALSGTPFFPPVDGAILLLEDVGEAPYRVDRMLTTLRLSGALARCAGVLVGDFTRCEPQKDGRDVDAVLRDRLGDLEIPVLMRVPVGHADDESWEVALGGLVELDADRGLVTFLQSAVARD
ncbi:MAG: LD-carboxypeptidase [Sandaracinus sp.]